MKYELKNEFLSVTLTTFGGTFTSIKDRYGIEYLWQGNEQYWKGQAAILFPICGSIRNNHAESLDGNKLSMPRHGLVRHLEFSMVKISDNSITFSIESNETTYQSYPYNFVLYVCYTLKDNQILTEYIIENTGSKKMPFFIGAHPAFNCPIMPNETYEDYYLEFDKEETIKIPTPIKSSGLIDFDNRIDLIEKSKYLTLTYDLFTVDSLIFDSIQSRKVSLKSKKNAYDITLEFPKFPYLVLWTSTNHGPFIAIEPWSGLSTGNDEDDIFEHKRNSQFILPLQKILMQYYITLNHLKKG